MPITRRRVASGALSAAWWLAVAPRSAPSADDAEAALAEIEARATGRLGVAVLDLEAGWRLERRAEERFPLCSTFKLLATAYVLARVDRGEEDLARWVLFSTADLVPYSPVTDLYAGEGMALGELCAAAMSASDNTAANLLLASFGGPPVLTAYLRSLGDEVTRLDRYEPELNEATPGDPRDTTTPAAMLANLQRLVLGDALSEGSREMLIGWMVSNTTGDTRLRAGLPAAWRVGDRTGSGQNGVANDIAVAWPPGRAPMLVAAYLAESPAPLEEREAVLAEVARVIATKLPQ
jgi:beta-lactamase class A